MKLRRRPGHVSDRRLRRLSTSALVEWFDVDLMGLGAAFDQYRFHGGPAGEVTARIEQLQKVWQEIADREQAKDL